MEMTRRELLKKSGKFILAHFRGRRRLGVRAGRQSRSRAQLRRDQALVGDGHRPGKMHRLRQLRARLRGGERRPRRLFPHLDRALSRP